MDRRIDAVELLDGQLDDPAALAGNLRDLRRINRWLGGVRLSADAIDALAAHREQLTVLDVGTASTIIWKRAKEWLRFVRKVGRM
jgi:hypothetical protein